MSDPKPKPAETTSPMADHADQPEIATVPEEPGLLIGEATGTNPALTSPPSPRFHSPVPFTHRVMLAGLGLFLLSGFSLSVYLKPNPQGFGTHRSLGLPPCSVRVLFGVPCPSCGMTTSFSHFVRGQIPSSLRANAAGTLLAAVCAFMVPWAVLTSWKGQHFLIDKPVTVFAWLLTGLATFTALHWVWRLWLDGYLS